MTILHIASLRNDPFTGVCVAAPEHIRNQKKFADVALLNVHNCSIEGIETQFHYRGKDWKDDVSSQFKKPDIVVFHEVYHVEFVVIAKSLYREGIPYVIIPHGCLVRSAQRKKRFKKILANKFVFHGFIYHSIALQCLSNNELLNTQFKVPKFIGTNGVNVPNISKMRFNTEKVHIVYIGRLEIIPKGLDLLLRAIKVIKEDADLANEKIVFNLYGPDVKGRYAEVESLIAQNDVEDVVELHHEIKGDLKQAVLLDADLFLQTSRHEGMPMGILEAMSYGIPCVITQGTSLGEITIRYDAGWVADCCVDSIASAIKSAIIEKNLWKQKSNNARRLIVDNFSWDSIAKETVEKYSSFLQGYIIASRK